MPVWKIWYGDRKQPAVIIADYIKTFDRDGNPYPSSIIKADNVQIDFREDITKIVRITYNAGSTTIASEKIVFEKST